MDTRPIGKLQVGSGADDQYFPMTSANFDGSGVNSCPIAGSQQSWESYEEDLVAWVMSTELGEEHIGPHIKSCDFSKNMVFGLVNGDAEAEWETQCREW